MNVTQAVFGVFHHFELAHQLQRRGHLQHIFSTWPWRRVRREGVARDLVGTFPLIHTADYLLNRTRFYPEAVSVAMNRWNALAFDQWTNAQVGKMSENPDAFIAISGAGLLTGRTVQQRGGKFVCDRGSTHHRVQDQILAEEYRRWGMPAPKPRPGVTAREEAIYEQADAITVPSSVALRSFLAMGVPAAKLHRIPYGVRLDRFTRTVEPPNSDASFEVLFAGHVSLRKGVPYLLEAFARLKHPNKHLTIGRDVPADFLPLLKRLPMENVTIAGPISQDELIKKMSASHLLVLPSVEEGLALVQGQAMACGCPVLATVATGSEDLFTDGVEGFIVQDRDVDALAARMQQVADDPALQQRFSEAAMQRVKSLGGWDAFGEAWDSLLHTLTGIPPAPSETTITHSNGVI